MPDLSALAGMFGGAGGGGAGGGMPDLSSLMSNPQVMEMAQNMMANGGMERLMQNPMMRNMVRPAIIFGFQTSRLRFLGPPCANNIILFLCVIRPRT